MDRSALGGIPSAGSREVHGDAAPRSAGTQYRSAASPVRKVHPVRSPCVPAIRPAGLNATLLLRTGAPNLFWAGPPAPRPGPLTTPPPVFFPFFFSPSRLPAHKKPPSTQT